MARAAGVGQGPGGAAFACRPAIWSRCCRRWCGWASCKGIRGPRGGYELARERRRITADDILRAAGTIEEAGDPAATAGSALLNDVVIPAVGQAERAFSVALSRINLDELVRKAEPLRDAHDLSRESQLATPGAIAAVHDLDSFGAIPLVRKVPMIRRR